MQASNKEGGVQNTDQALSPWTTHMDYTKMDYATELTTPENTITYHNALCLSPQNFA